jgi:hypothetical protein
MIKGYEEQQTSNVPLKNMKGQIADMHNDYDDMIRTREETRK